MFTEVSPVCNFYMNTLANECRDIQSSCQKLFKFPLLGKCHDEDDDEIVIITNTYIVLCNRFCSNYL